MNTLPEIITAINDLILYKQKEIERDKLLLSKLNKAVKILESEKKEKEQKETVKAHLFSDSEFYNFEIFESQFQGTEYQVCDLKIYYERVKNWSASKGAKRNDWIATARNFILKDQSEDKIIYKQGYSKKVSSHTEQRFNDLQELKNNNAQLYGNGK